MPLCQSSKLSAKEVSDHINSVSWYHSVEILPGIIAPGSLPKGGRYDVEAQVHFVEDSAGGLSGKRILEIGTWDGPLAYKLKSLGHDVIATDIQNPEKTGFAATGTITGLDVPYVRCSVYELPQHFEQEFDVVLFMGVFYHLKYPILAFERIAKVLKPGGRVVVAGSGMSHHFESLAGEGLSSQQSEEFQEILDQMDEAGVPLCLSYPGNFLDGNNWFLPNKKALEGWMRAAGLEGGYVAGTPSEVGVLSLIGWAEKMREKSVTEHGLVGEAGGYSSDLKI
jgi:tRNA (mo5U34)-methyltransferase